jgi:hypothetical protein
MGDVNWIHLAQDRDQWRDLVNTVTSFLVPKTLVSSYVAAELLTDQEGLCSTDLVKATYPARWSCVTSDGEAVSTSVPTGLLTVLHGDIPPWHSSAIYLQILSILLQTPWPSSANEHTDLVTAICRRG